MKTHPKTQRIVFFGTPEFSVPCLHAIIQSGRDVPLVVTQPDKPSGRGKKLKAPAIKNYCQEHAIPCIQPQKIRQTAFYQQLAKVNADIFVVVAYGRIFTQKHLSLAPYTLNVHASLLPQWRGASPMQRALQQGDTQTGVSIMQLVEELDAGDVMLQNTLPIPVEMRFEQLYAQLSTLGAQSIVHALDLIDTDQAHFTEQEHAKATFSPPIRVDEARIDFSNSALDIHNQIRAFHLWPGAFCEDQFGRIKLLHSQLSCPQEDFLIKKTYAPGELLFTKKQLWVKTADAWLEILEIQVQGKKHMPVQAFLGGYKSKQIQHWS